MTRQISNLIESAENPEEQEEAIRKREEQEMVDDYNARLGETQGREIEHLVLVTHGIGQLLGLRFVLVQTPKGRLSLTHEPGWKALTSFTT